MKVAVIHEWLVNYAGSERVLEQIIRLFPDADLFSQIDFLSHSERGFVLHKNVRTSFIQKLPGAQSKYQRYLPLMPFAVRRFDISPYDVIISNSHSVAKGVKKKPGQLQICYCHTPMRYAWDLRDQYLHESGLDVGIRGIAVKYILDRIKSWDYKTAQQIDFFIANSHYIKDRIKRAYDRDAVVIYPPVNVDAFQVNEKKDDYFLTVSRMVPYKKINLIVEAFSEMGRPLIVIGDGPDFAKVKAAAGNNVEFLGYQKDEVVKEYMMKAKAFVFAAEEDFGIVPVEAQACGTPVIAFGKGGVTETVIPIQTTGDLDQDSGQPSPTGIFFDEQRAGAVIEAIKKFETVEDKFDPSKIRMNSERFSIKRFQKELKAFVEEKINDFFS